MKTVAGEVCEAISAASLLLQLVTEERPFTAQVVAQNGQTVECLCASEAYCAHKRSAEHHFNVPEDVLHTATNF